MPSGTARGHSSRAAHAGGWRGRGSAGCSGRAGCPGSALTCAGTRASLPASSSSAFCENALTPGFGVGDAVPASCSSACHNITSLVVFFFLSKMGKLRKIFIFDKAKCEMKLCIFEFPVGSGVCSHFTGQTSETCLRCCFTALWLQQSFSNF